MKVRVLAALAALVVLVGLLAPAPAGAEVADGWDYRSLSLNGTYKPLVGQFGGDASTDVFWYSPGSGADTLWIGNAGQRGQTSFSKSSLAVTASYVPIVGDFSGDDYDDILWYRPGTGGDVLWTSVPGSAHFSATAITINGTFYPYVLHDYTGAGRKDDILWYVPGTGKDYLWHFNEDGSGYVTKNLTINGTFQMILGDWNADRLEDLVLYAAGTGADYRWAAKADGTFATSSLTVNSTFTPVTIHQTTGDGILWWGQGTAKEAYWVRNGSKFSSVAIRSVSITATPFEAGLGAAGLRVGSGRDGAFVGTATGGDFYTLAGTAHDKSTQQPVVGDFDGDGYVDIAWYGAGTVADELWYTAPSAALRGAGGGALRATPIRQR